VPGPLAAVWLAATAVGAVVLWLIDRGVIGRRPRTPATDTTGPMTPITTSVSPAVLGYLVSAGDGHRCRCLDDAASASVADLVRRGVIGVHSRDSASVRLLTDIGGDTELSSADALVLAHLRATSWPRRGDRAVVTSGTLAHHRPARRWWFMWRRAVVAEARANGWCSERVPAALLAPIWALGVIGTLVGVGRIAAAVITFDPGPLEPWTLVGCALAALVGCVGLDRWGDPDDNITADGRAVVESRVERGIGVGVLPTTGLGQHVELPEAVACGISGAAIAEAPMLDHRRRRHLWSDVTGQPRVVRVVHPFIPGRGGRPLTVAIAGAVLIAAAGFIAPLADRMTSWTGVDTVLDTIAPGTDVDIAIDRYNAVVNGVSWALGAIGVWLVLAGVVDTAIRRTRVGAVVSVSVVDDRTWWQRLAHRVAAVGHDGTAVVEIAVDDGHRTTVRSWMVDARAAAPHGATVEVSFTPLLGRVRRIAPVGDAGAAVGARSDTV